MNNYDEQKQPSTQPEVLRANALRKTYGQRLAVKDLSFSLLAGRVMGFLGPNGAGKTTSIRILTTMLEPDAGNFFVAGISSDQPDKIRARIGVLPENLGFPKHMTGAEFLTYFGQLYGRSRKDAKSTSQALLEEVGMQQRGKSLIGTYSHGMKQRLGIARALVNNPVVVFLDEPTLGLDPRGQQELLALIRRIAQERGTGVVLCSHLLSEIEAICDDVIILSVGQVVAEGPVREVINQAHHGIMRVRVPAQSVDQAQSILRDLPIVKNIASTGQMGGWIGIELVGREEDEASQPDSGNKILEELIRYHITVLGFEAEGGRLQDVFLQLTEETIK